MPTLEEARRIVLDDVAPLGVERVYLSRADGRVLAEPFVAPRDLPHWDNSAMDGYALRSEDCAAPPVTLPVRGYLPAGATGGPPVAPGTAVKIMTGAPVPEGCDAVVPFEETVEGEGVVTILHPVKSRAHIRFRGEDIAAGTEALAAGTVLRPPEIGLLAASGKVLVGVHRRPRVAILSTGDELVEPGDPLLPGTLVNSNSPALAAAVARAGGEPALLGIARDDRDELGRKIAEGMRADALVTTAGVSAGDRDFVRDVLERLGVALRFHRVGIKPGGPTVFGVKGGRPVFSLPGNPVSAMITFEMFVRPALRRMAGHADPVAPTVPAVLKEATRKKPGKVHFYRVRLERYTDGSLVATNAGDQNTGILATLVRADGIAILPAERTGFSAGERVEVHLLYP